MLPKNLISRGLLCVVAAALLWHPKALRAQSDQQQIEELRQMVLNLQARVSAMEQQNAALRKAPAFTGPSGPDAAAALASASVSLQASQSAAPASSPASTAPPAQPAAAASAQPLSLPGGATLNFMLDGYYGYNFNHPPGRANDLRAYDVLSNAFSINQADVIFALDPDLTVHRRYGVRLDLQFGQATDTLQGNPANEPRPQIYRNLFQAYGTYIVPLGSGLSVDFGKWASSLGVEGNYTKDQMNDSRAFTFYFLPFYHSGVRTHYQLNRKLGLNYWLVNGINQTEPFSSFKDQLFGYTLTPAKSLTWTFNYYYGQDHPDSTPSSSCPVPLQTGLCATPIVPAPNGKTHIFDTYATWQATPKLTLQGEADYFLQRQWAQNAPGESDAPTHVTDGAAYLRYQLTSRGDFAARGEYFSDRNGLFSGTSQALKEFTGTYEVNLGDGFLSFLEYRRDWSNRPYFQTSTSPSQHQDTATIGLVWWYGAKQGSW